VPETDKTKPDYAERVLQAAVGLAAGARFKMTERGPRDAKIISLAILSRTISNYKGVLALIRAELLVEARTLTRCCYENLLWIAALRDRGDRFVDEMIEDEMGNRRTLGELILKLTSDDGADMDSDGAKFIRASISEIKKKYPKLTKLNVNKTAARGPVEHAYISYSRLSLDSVHPSISALGRHVRSKRDGNTMQYFLDITPSHRALDYADTLRMACEALLGVSIGTNEILGGSSMNESLNALRDEV
jgi:hypothetical protein